jgi:hypothetical protein
MCDGDGEKTAGDDWLAPLTAVVDRLSTRPRPDRTPEQVGTDLVRLRHELNRLELEFATDAARFAATDEYDEQGACSPYSWIKHNCRMAGGPTYSAICVGENLATLPRSVEALSAGRIGFGHLALLAGTAHAVMKSSTGGTFDEAPLLRRAKKHTIARFRHECEHARHAADAQAFLDEHVQGVELRRLELFPCGGGGLIVRGVLDAEGGATLRTALDPLARRDGAGDERPLDRRLADALVDLAAHCLDEGRLPQCGGVRPHLQVSASLDTLRGLVGAPAGELEYGGTIPAASVQRLACDASITRILLGPDSAVVDVGRSTRVPPAATRRALRHRDNGCVWPGCGRPASWTEVHHLQHWGHFGVTEMPNLVLLCRKHHWNAHEGGWHLVRCGDGSVRAIPPLPDRLPPARAPDPATTAA